MQPGRLPWPVVVAPRSRFFVKYIDGDSAEIRSENEKNEGFCYFEV